MGNRMGWVLETIPIPTKSEHLFLCVCSTKVDPPSPKSMGAWARGRNGLTGSYNYIGMLRPRAHAPTRVRAQLYRGARGVYGGYGIHISDSEHHITKYMFAARPGNEDGPHMVSRNRSSHGSRNPR